MRVCVYVEVCIGRAQRYICTWAQVDCVSRAECMSSFFRGAISHVCSVVLALEEEMKKERAES